jgi:hypothetical protein
VPNQRTDPFATLATKPGELASLAFVNRIEPTIAISAPARRYNGRALPNVSPVAN